MKGKVYLIKVGRQPVHNHIKGIVEGKVVDDDGPHSRVGQHACPGGSWGASLLFRLS